MTKIKLVDGTILNATDVEVVHGVLKISTTESTVEELAELFSNKENTNLIVLMTESDIEVGFKSGFTSFAGINFNADGVKTVELFQPKDVTEARVSNAEGTANNALNVANSANDTAKQANNTANSAVTTADNAGKTATNANKTAKEASDKADGIEEQNMSLMETVDSILTDIIPSLMVQ